MLRLRSFWLWLSSTLWFVPSSCVLVAMLLALGLTALDVVIGHDWTEAYPLFFGVGADGARGMLSSIAGSMMTVASLTFSLTISTLATASSQYTSRIIRNFMRDRLNQLVLGSFVGLFAYCLVVLRSIRGGDEGAFIPAIAVMAGLVLALCSIGVLIFFIHHIAASIQAGVILERVARETLSAIAVWFPQDMGQPASAHTHLPDKTEAPGTVWHAVTSGHMGYVQGVDEQALINLAAGKDTVVRMEADIGAFVSPHSVLCSIALVHPLDEALLKNLRGAYSVGRMRTVEQDPAFGIRQLVDIGLRALSPGINDTTTGVMCVNYLGAILETLTRRDIPDRLRAQDGTLRVIARGRSFETLVGLCFDQIRLDAGTDVAVMRALLRAFSHAAWQTGEPSRRHVLRLHAERVAQVAHQSLHFEYDRTQVRALLDECLRELAPLDARRAETLLPNRG
ncbi:MAG: DUF2254 domain-containing protein [Cystobacter sp.]